MASTKNARMPTVKTSEELQAVLDLAYARLQGYPPGTTEREKIREQIAGLERRLGKSGGAGGGVANGNRTAPNTAGSPELRQPPESAPVDMTRPAPSAPSVDDRADATRYAIEEGGADPLADLRD
jgi:hypothetical protein